MSSSFTGSSTRGMSELDREIEYRLGKLGQKLTSMDVFTDEFSPPGVSDTELPENAQPSKKPYGAPHDDYTPEADQTFVRAAAAGKASDQEEYDDLDEAVGRYNKKIKDYEDQFPGSRLFSMERMLSKLAKGLDGQLWTKAKDASKEAFGEIRWPFVQWWYEDKGGK